MKKAAAIIPSVLAEVIGKAPLCDEKVTFAWRTVVGPAVDRVTKVRLDADGVLHVIAVDQHWAREVRDARRVILGRLTPLLGNSIRSMEVRSK